MGWRFGVLFIRYLEVGRVWLVLICGTWYVRGGGSHGEVCMGCGEGGGASWGIRGWIWESVVGFRGGGGEFEELAQRCLVFVVRFKSVVLLICVFPVDEYGSRLGAE